MALLDIQLPDLDGVEVARRLAEERLDTATVLISTLSMRRAPIAPEPR